MTAPAISRRALLTGMARGTIVAGAALPGSAWAAVLPQSPFRAIGDLGREGGRALQAAAHSAGCDFADPEGEIVRLLQGPAIGWLAPSSQAPVIGYTGWSDYLLARDLARDAGRRIVHARLIDAGQGRDLATPHASAPARALLDAVCGDCRDGGVAWILQ
ncbi:hypothetical protein [Novosphingobium sp. Fuku2-ISO-50]|uniref:hypothetical protein n=1 Tax=Novosphingobium sp. Fuku2-ISO-50 TaxID=1739114 RepID=UPI00076D50EE|nr:hypothetical protein [Novosphingobium sp. Fuku2-ISO-50]KUR75166.1 hypothetical protein AQZ50_16210 [Novosphingobium sp. Fuku2-ISO-50]